MALSNTTFWLVAVAMVLGFAVIAWAINHWLLKDRFNMKIAVVAGAVVGALGATGLWFMKMKKPTASVAGRLIEVDREGRPIMSVTPETFIEQISTQ